MIWADRRLNNHDHYHEGGPAPSEVLHLKRPTKRTRARVATRVAQEQAPPAAVRAKTSTTAGKMSPLLGHNPSDCTIRSAMWTRSRMQAPPTSFSNKNNKQIANQKTKKLHYSSKLAFLVLVALMTTIFLLACSTESVASLNCYTCSSADDPGCDESFSGLANFTKDTDCERQIGRPAKVCRKIVQYLEDKKIVIRSCGWIDEHDEKEQKPMCYKRSGTFALMMESCICYENNCNHSASLVPNQSVLLLLASLSVLVYCLVGGGRRPPGAGPVGGH